MAIRAKLLLLFGLVAAAPMALVAVASYQHSVRSVEALVEERAVATVREMAAAAAARLEVALQVLDVLASNQEADDLYAVHRLGAPHGQVVPRVERFFGQVFTRTPSPFSRVRYVDLEGLELFRYPRAAEGTLGTVAGASGSAPGTAAAPEDAGAVPGLDLSIYAAAPGVSLHDEYDPRVGAVLRLVARIHRLADGGPAGWILADIPATPLIEDIVSQRPRAGQERVLVVESSDARLLYPPRRTYLGQSLAQVSPRVSDLLGAATSPVGTARADLADGPSLVTWARLDRPDWTIITVSPQSAASAAVRQAGAYNLAVTAIALTLAAALILLAIARITGSIRRVTDGARAIAAGDLDQQIAVGSHDETRTLADSFNHMAASLRRTLTELQQFNQELEDRVELRTRDLASRTADLEQANQRLEQLNQALAEANEQVGEATRHKSEFLSRMSHDLRTPMNAILGYTRILLRRGRGVLDERQFHNLENIQTSADNLLRLINEILDLSRIEAGRIEIKPEPVDLDLLVRECITSVAPLARPEVELSQDVGRIPRINTDADRIRGVVMNLLGNAVKFTERGRITVSLEPADGGVRLAVADTGVGIPPEDLPHIFEEFRQVERQVGEQREGTGLGLAIAARSVEMLGGTITVESQVGQGTTFTVSIGDYGL